MRKARRNWWAALYIFIKRNKDIIKQNIGNDNMNILIVLPSFFKWVLELQFGLNLFAWNEVRPYDAARSQISTYLQPH